MPGGNCNVVGRYYEVLFKAECLKRDLLVLTPECPSLAFDVAVFSRGKFLTVQVKGTGQLKKTGKGNRANFMCNGSYRQKTYHERGVDFFAAYVGPRKSWYIIPTICLTTSTLEIGFSPEAKASEWLERWDLLGAPLEVD